MSAEPHTIPTAPTPAPESAPCSNCGAPVAFDQHYCLNCGERQVQARSRFLSGVAGREGQEVGASVLPAPPGARASASSLPPAVTWLAGVGVLLLAMGVGVLIGRSGGGKAVTVPPQVVSVNSGGVGPATGVGSTPAPTTTAPLTGATFSDEWPAGKDGYTVQLQTLPVAGSQVSEVTALKQAASVKGAKAIGALRSDDYKGLPSGLYVIYSGVYSSAAQAKQALGGLKAKFPAASVIHVAGSSKTGAGSTASGSTSSKSNPSSGGSSGKSSAPTSTPKGSGESGQSFEQKTRNEPDVVETG